MPLSEYKLYVSDHCEGCEKVVAEIAKKSLSVKTVNIDDGHIELPFAPLVLPALVKKNKIVGYGVKDIIALLDHNA